MWVQLSHACTAGYLLAIKHCALVNVVVVFAPLPSTICSQESVIMSAKKKCMYCLAVLAVLMYFVTAGSVWALAQVLRKKEIGTSFGAFAVTATFVVCGLVIGATDKCRSCGAFFLAIGAILSLITNFTGAGFLIYDIIQTPRDLDNYTVLVGVGAASAFLALLTGLSCCCCYTWCACVKGRDENGKCICCSTEAVGDCFEGTTVLL